VDAVMSELQVRVRERLRHELAGEGADAAYQDPQLFADVERLLAAAARAGESLVVYPEGTFTRAPGLREFHLGAFAAAAQSGRPVVPVALRGTRSVLRDGSWLPRRRPVAVFIDAPLWPRGADWRDALALRDAARRAILAHCNEPDRGMATG
jgi:1-acyl-sn-glycerol-3-phosphate acyltransferase